MTELKFCHKGSVRVRTYRNRRIGDFLKELHLTEGRCTGVLKIHNAMQSNGRRHLYLKPLVKDGLLKYVYPERGNSPNQAYKA
jgi:predicted HTH transcriptional regulator